MEPSSNTPVKLAFCIGAYRLCDFVHLGLKQIRRLAPDSNILVSDDAAPESPVIKAIAEGNGASYCCSRVRKGHFSADLQSFINALVFAEAAGADIAVKVSQRFIFLKPEALDAITKAFEDPAIAIVTPGQPNVTGAFGKRNGFGHFTILTDVCAMRVGPVSPSDLLHLYRTRLLTEKLPWTSFVECTVDDLCRNKLSGKALKLEAITNHVNVDDPAWLRRYQNCEEQYHSIAATHGLSGRYPCSEWAELEKQSYISRPLCV